MVTLRANFSRPPLLHPAFGARLGEALVNVTPLSAHGLLEAASIPHTITRISAARALMLAQLPSVTLSIVRASCRSLRAPLTELFERRAGDVWTGRTCPTGIGGVRGAGHPWREGYLR